MEDSKIIQYVNSYSENEAIYRYPLRLWLTYHLDHHTFPGVEWMDNTSTYFRIPWTNYGQPNWFDDSKIFVVIVL